MKRPIQINDREYFINFECVPELNADRQIIWHDAENGTAVHHNTVVSIVTKQNVIPVDDFMFIMSQVRELEMKSIVQTVQIDLS